MKDTIEEFRNRFPMHGEFTFSQGQDIRKVVRGANVPDEYGVYIISDPQGDVLYIGRGGTMKNDGTFKGQTLRQRLTNKQGGLPRQHFFENLLRERQIVNLHFEWFITFDEINRILPSFAETELLQAHFNTYGNLPSYNSQG